MLNYKRKCIKLRKLNEIQTLLNVEYKVEYRMQNVQ